MKKNSMVKYILPIILSFVLIMVLTGTSVYAGDDDVTEDVDLFGDDDIEEYTSDSITYSVTGYIYYDVSLERYCYPIVDIQGFPIIYCSIMDGMIVTDDVYVGWAENYDVKVYRNGKEVTVTDGLINKTGQYNVTISNNGTEEQVLAFTIVNDITGKINSYRMPNNFAILSAYRDGEEVELEDRQYIELEEEGDYIINYSFPKGKLNYKLAVTIDHTAPTLKLEALDSKNQARGPVDISDVEKGATIKIKKDGKLIDYSETLTKSGDYVIRISDEAGNYTDYSFTIRIYFNLNSILFFVLVLLIAGVVMLYIYMQRKKFRVR